MPSVDCEWISGREAAKRLGVTGPTVPTVARAADIRVKVLPGLPAKYSASDIALVVAESIRGNGPRVRTETASTVPQTHQRRKTAGAVGAVHQS